MNFLRRTGYRLPTEEEWEYACRAGSQTGCAHGEAVELLGRHGWVVNNSGGKSHPVASRRTNDWGLYDLHGNAWEWCQDRWQQKQKAGEDCRRGALPHLPGLLGGPHRHTGGNGPAGAP